MNFRKFFLFFAIIHVSSISLGQAQCVFIAHALTVSSINNNFNSEMNDVEDWMENVFLPDIIYPAFRAMAHQWLQGDMKAIEEYATFSTHQQMELTKTEIKRLEAENIAQLQPEDGMCARITHRVGLLAAHHKAEEARKSLSNSMFETMLSKPGSSGQANPVAHAIGRYTHYFNNACTGDDLGGVLSGAGCSLPNDRYANSDIDPMVHFENATADSSDPTGADVSHFHAFAENLSGGQNISPLPDRYYDDHSRKTQLLDLYGYQQYAAFSKDSIASYASLRAPGASPRTPEQTQGLQDNGFSLTDINEVYGAKPSVWATMEQMIFAHKTPKSLGQDQMKPETGLLAQDALTLSTELMLWKQHRDAWAQETRNLSLVLGMRLRKQRKVANAGLLAVSDNGKKN